MAGPQGEHGPAGPAGVGLPADCQVGDLPMWDGQAWVCSDHAADPDAHHPADATGLDLAPRSVRIGDTVLVAGRLDLGPGVSDELTVANVQTLTGGGNADALHQHAGQAGGGAGGVCYTAWGTSQCGAGFSVMYAGTALQGRDNIVNIGTGIGDTICSAVTPQAVQQLNANWNILPTWVAIRPGGGSNQMLYVNNLLPCAVCCK